MIRHAEQSDHERNHQATAPEDKLHDSAADVIGAKPQRSRTFTRTICKMPRIPPGTAPVTVAAMDGHVDDRQTTGAPDGRSKVYRDLRRRNERRAGLARTLKARRRQRFERDTEAVRRPRFTEAAEPD